MDRKIRVGELAQAEAKLQENGPRRRGVTKDHYLAEGVLYVPEEARFERLLDMEEEKDLGAAQIYEHCFEISTKTERASTRAAPEPSSLASTRGRLGAAGDL